MPRRDRRQFCSFLPCLFIGLVWMASPTAAAEFYSWIDPSGTMVLTDDPSRIPSAGQRSPLSVHHFHPSSPSSSLSTMTSDTRVRMMPREQSDPQEGSDPDAQNVLLDRPEESIASNYTWVPLQIPLFLRSRPVAGFWWRAGGSSPLDALNVYLLQNGRHLRNHALRRVPSNVRPSSWDPVYEQVVRERHLIQQAIARHAHSAPATSGPESCCAQGRAGMRDRGAVR